MAARGSKFAGRLFRQLRSPEATGAATCLAAARQYSTSPGGPAAFQWSPYRAAAGLAVAGLASYAVVNYVVSPARPDHLTKLQADEHPHDIGTFTLTEARGKPFTEKNVKKEFALLLFGSIDHPEIHTWLDKFAKAVYESDEKCNQEHLKPILLSLDAEKDTPERCKELLDSLNSHHLWKATFHRRVAIVTGEDTAKVHEAAHSFTRKFFNKDPKNTGTPCSTDLGDIYMVSPEGKFLMAYGLADNTPEAVSDDWARVQKDWNIYHPSWHGCRNVAKRYA